MRGSWVATRQRWTGFWFEPSTPTNLAVCRVLTYGAALLYYRDATFAEWAGFPRLYWSPIWLFGDLGLPVLSAATIGWLTSAWKAALALACVGLFTRGSAAASFVLGLYLFGLDESALPRTARNAGFAMMVFLILAISRCGDALSLDALRRRRPGAGPVSRPSGEYTWPLRCVWVLLAFVMASAGLSKLRHSGPDWVFSDTLATYLTMADIPPSEGGSVLPPLGSWGVVLSRHPSLCRVIAAGVVAFELLYPLALILPRARPILLPAACAMLVSFHLLLGPPSVRFAAAHIFWVPWDRLRRTRASRKLRVAALALAVPAGLALLWAFSLGRARAPERPPGPPWLADLGEPLSLSPEEVQAVGGYAWRRLGGGAAPVLPARLALDFEPRVVFLSASDGRSGARVAIGRGRGLMSAIESALARLPRDREDRWLKLDIVLAARTIDSSAQRLPAAFDRTRHGLAFADREAGVLAEELVAQGLVDAEQRLKWGALRLHARRTRPDSAELPAAPPARLLAFTAQGLFVSQAGTWPLYRGHRLGESLEADRARAALKGAKEYLIRAVGPDGRFAYLYDPVLDRLDPRYNLVRHAGTLYAMAELYRAFPDERLLRANRRALDYLLKHGRDAPDGGLWFPERGRATVGASALAAVALAEHMRATGDRGRLGELRRLGRAVLEAQRPDGDFAHYRDPSSREELPGRSEYFSGEAVLALVRLYRADRDPRWLKAAERGATYLIAEQEARGGELPHDHWLLYALDGLHRVAPRPEYRRHAMRLARAIRARQNRGEGPEDWLGGWGSPPRSTPAATRTEGLCAAYRLARDFGHPAQARILLGAVELGNRFQLQLLIGPEQALYFPNPERVLGGVRRDFDSPSIRNDYVQHTVSSLLCWLGAASPQRPDFSR